ncbi:MAG: hypothetical protein K2Q26_03335 [Bdellovibrionales bacterium]|nr:hypothetical protein [Bdellovibrionales bacterium]
MRILLILIMLLGPIASILDISKPQTTATTRGIASTEDYQTCSFESGETGKIKFKGATKEEAFERTAKACLKARMAFYVTSRGSAPSTERQILFAEDCVNKTFCKR